MPTGHKRRPSMRDVARVAGVSQTTVSFVINDVPDAHIPKATKERVGAGGRRVGYRPNAIARGLGRDATDTIGFVSDAVTATPSGWRMIQGAQDAAWERGKLLVLVSTGGDPLVEARALATLVDRRVDGVVYAPPARRGGAPAPTGRRSCAPRPASPARASRCPTSAGRFPAPRAGVSSGL
jgi:LacI family transcriptional regulator